MIQNLIDSEKFPYQGNSFDSNVGYLKSHNNLDLEIMFMVPHNQAISNPTTT